MISISASLKTREIHRAQITPITRPKSPPKTAMFRNVHTTSSGL